VAVELGIGRKLLYEWRVAYRALGAAGLNRKRGPKAGARKAAGLASPAASSFPDVVEPIKQRGDYGDSAFY
jgi:hypothetical protein